MTSEQTRYKAFLSYSTADRQIAERLHTGLESYRIPKQLIGRTTPHGPIPARLFPIFRDRDELPSSPDLNQEIRNALERSDFLIVICSPRSVGSAWVGSEILAFKRMGREDRILAYIAEGEPSECFPQPLRFKVGADGELTDTAIVPLAADPRPSGDGEENAKLKIIAGLIGVGFDELKQRDREASRRRAHIKLAVGATLVVLGLAAEIGATEAWKGQVSLQDQQSRDIAAHARSLPPERAVPELLEALPRSVRHPTRRYLPDVAGQLSLALDRSRDLRWLATSGDVKEIHFAAREPMLMAVSSDDSLDVWNARTGTQELHRKVPFLADANISADGKQVVLTGGTAGSPLRLLKAPATVGGQWSETTLRLLSAPGKSKSSQAFSVAPDGSIIVAFWDGFGSENGGLVSMDLATSQIYDLKPLDCRETPSFLSEGGLAVTQCNNQLQVWRLGRELRAVSLAGPLEELPFGTQIAVSRDREYLAIAPYGDTQIWIFRATDGVLVGRHDGSDPPLALMTFVGDSHALMALRQEGKGLLVDEKGAETSIGITNAPGSDETDTSLSDPGLVLATSGKTSLVIPRFSDSLEIRSWPSGRTEARAPNDVNSAITAVASSPTADIYLVGRKNGSFELRAGSSAALIRSVKLDHGTIEKIVISPDGSVALAKSDKAVCVIDLTQDKEAGCHTFEQTPDSFAPVPDAGLWIGLVKGSLEIRSNAGPANSRSLPLPDTDQRFLSAVFDPTGKLIAAQSSSKHDTYTVLVFDLKDGTTLQRWSTPNGSDAKLSFDPSGRFLVAISSWGKQIEVFDLTTGERAWENNVDAISCGFDGGTVLIALAGGGTSAYDLATGRPIPERSDRERSVVALSEDQRVVVTRDDNFALVTLSDGTQLSRQLAGIWPIKGRVSLSADGKLLAFANNQTLPGNIIAVREAADPRPPEIPNEFIARPIRAAQLSGDGKLLVAAGRDDAISVVDVARKMLLTRVACECGEVRAVAVGADGLRAVVVGSSAAVTLDLSALTVTKRKMFDGFRPTKAEVSDDLSTAALLGDGVRVLRLADGALEKIPPAEPGALYAPSYLWLSRDGSKLAFVNLNLVAVVDIRTKEIVFRRDVVTTILEPILGAFDNKGEAFAIVNGGKLSAYELASKQAKAFDRFVGHGMTWMTFVDGQDRILLGSDISPAWLVDSTKSAPEQLNQDFVGMPAQAGSDKRLVTTAPRLFSANGDLSPLMLWDFGGGQPAAIRQFSLHRSEPKPAQITTSRDGKTAFVFDDATLALIVTMDDYAPQTLINESCRRVVASLTPDEKARVAALAPKLWIDTLQELTTRLFFYADAEARPDVCPPLEKVSRSGP